jgi:ATP-dependent DNA ligase
MYGFFAKRTDPPSSSLLFWLPTLPSCLRLRPEAVAQIEFLEWTEGDRLRHSKFVGLRDDKEPRDVVKDH